MRYLRDLQIRGKKMRFPIYFPDATKAVVRSLDASDLQRANVEGVVVNTYHLMLKPGASVVGAMGGIGSLMNWDGWIASDSGGFQILSLIQSSQSGGKVTDNGIVFYGGAGGKKRHLFTPEKSIQVQCTLGADIMICLDDFTPPRANSEQIDVSVTRTIEWAKRCKEEFLKQVDKRGWDEKSKPKLFGVIQGGDDKEARERCAQGLIKIGFDGYGFGGWPLDKEGNLNFEITAFTASLTPDDLPRFALGVGNPQNIVECFRVGYHIFDCVLPTRDARHRRLYVFTDDPDKKDLFQFDKIHSYVYILREKYVRDNRPVSEFCDCYTCQNYSRAYLHHLFRIEDVLAWRLSTIHNLRMYTRLTDALRKYVDATK